MIRVLYIPIVGEPTVKEIDDTLEAMQALVGGNIECLGNMFDCGLDLFVNETGKLDGLPPNRILIGPGGQDILVGNLFFSKHNAAGDTVSLTDADVKKALRFLADHTVPVADELHLG